MHEIESFKEIKGEQLQPMPQVFYCAGLVAEFDEKMYAAHSKDDFDEAQKWAVALEDARKGLHDAIAALPEEDRKKLVAMYETLRHWAYR